MRFKCALYFEVEATDAVVVARLCRQVSTTASRLGAQKVVVGEIYDENEKEFDAEGKST